MLKLGTKVSLILNLTGSRLTFRNKEGKVPFGRKFYIACCIWHAHISCALSQLLRVCRWGFFLE